MNTKDIRTVLQLGDFLPPAWLFAGAIFSFFWGIALILSSSKYNLSDPRFLFGILLGILSLWMGNGALFFGNMYLEFPILFGIHIPFALLCGPLLLLYYSSLFKGESDKIYLFHFFPSLISVLLFIPFLDFIYR